MTVTPAGHGPSITGTGAGSVTGLPPSAPEAHSHSATHHPAPRVRRTRPRRHDAAGTLPPDSPVLRPHHDEATLPDADLLKASADHSAWRQDETGRGEREKTRGAQLPRRFVPENVNKVPILSPGHQMHAKCAS